LQSDETNYGDEEAGEDIATSAACSSSSGGGGANLQSSTSTERGNTMATKPLWGVPASATFVGHVGGVVGADFIDRGRTFVSCSRDGTARLWDCPSQTTLTVFGTLDFDRPAIDCSVVLSATSQSTTAAVAESLLVAYQSGAVALFDARAGSAEQRRI